MSIAFSVVMSSLSCQLIHHDHDLSTLYPISSQFVASGHTLPITLIYSVSGYGQCFRGIAMPIFMPLPCTSLFISTLIYFLIKVLGFNYVIVPSRDSQDLLCLLLIKLVKAVGDSDCFVSFDGSMDVLWCWCLGFLLFTKVYKFGSP